MSKFKIGLYIVFSVFIVLAVIVFASSKSNSSGPAAHITIWGFLSANDFNTFFQGTSIATSKTLTVTYVAETPATFQNDFVNALANGTPPDVVMISEDELYTNENKLFVIPYASYNERTFKNTFIQEGEDFLSPTGVYGVPFVVDPLVMYWNRDVFNTASVSQPPQYWDQFLTLPQQLSKVDASGNITQSAVALGEWTNVMNAKAILANLMLQAGTPIVDTTGATPQSALLYSATNQSVSPAESSVDFYTQFANPAGPTYSWNRAMDDSQTVFLAGNLGVYFGFASELAGLRAKNPNLNFDVAAMPQPRQATTKTIFAKIYALSIVKQSKNVSAAFQVIAALTTADSIGKLDVVTDLPPVRRDLLASLPTDPYQDIFYQSALVAKGWLDPNTQATDQTFENMIESITGGQANTGDALSTANDKLNALLAHPTQ
jgi:ABC-type glycerol-3-phosphate transport system substrate-binding protein